MAAEEILRFALFKEVLKPERRKKRKLNNGQADEESDEEEEEDEAEEEEEEEVTREARAKARAKAKRMEGGPSAPTPIAQPAAEPAPAPVPDVPADVNMDDDSAPTTIRQDRLDLFRSRLSVLFETAFEGVAEFTELLPKINEGLPAADLFSTSEGRAAVQRMNDLNEIMESEGMVYSI
jgi:DNA replication licensing factor MCM3